MERNNFWGAQFYFPYFNINSKLGKEEEIKPCLVIPGRFLQFPILTNLSRNREMQEGNHDHSRSSRRENFDVPSLNFSYVPYSELRNFRFAK